MSTHKPFYITTTLPYVNAAPHMGHALEFVRADIIARHKQLLGHEVFFNTGTDEHGVKIYEKALEAGVSPQAYVDDAAQPFKDLLATLGIMSEVHFIRTTDEHHVAAAQAFWKRCEKDIYKDTYKVRYCVGCELEKTDSDLNDDGRCPEHPDRELEIREEENYFFKFSAYAEKLIALYENNPQFVVPHERLAEIKSFVERGLTDFSISRVKEKMPWGVPVPDDPDHVMYVWFDALVNYISTLGWPESETDSDGAFQRFWAAGTPTQYAGKDNLRQQSAMWQAMLMSAGLPNSHQIVIDGFVISEGKKMSKSIGNVIDPITLVDEYGTDALRYYIARELHPFSDSDMTVERVADAYNANLANGLGNLASRVVTMVSKYGVEVAFVENASYEEMTEKHPKYTQALESFRLDEATDYIWKQIASADEFITTTEPFKTIKEDEDQAHRDIREVAGRLHEIAVLLEPFLPETATRIKKALEEKRSFDAPLFPRK